MKVVRIPKVKVGRFTVDGDFVEEEDRGVTAALYSLMSGRMDNVIDLMVAAKIRQKLVNLNSQKKGYRDLVLENAEYDLMKKMLVPEGNYPKEMSITAAMAPVVEAFQNPIEKEK